jgi:citrate lyase subunit beta/citryl-CoA lyase
MFAHAWASDAEAIIFDLEDSVPPEQKPAARAAISALRPPPAWLARPIFVRLNAVGGADFDADVVAAAGAPVTGVMIPKVEHASQVQATDQAIRDQERQVKSLLLILLIETPGGVLRLAEIVDAGVNRVIALAFGAEDYRAGIGVTALDPVMAEFARCSIVNAAAAAGIPAIDAPFLRLNDLDGLRIAARRARELGFRSKMVIHPSHVPVIHEVFSRGEDHAWAARVVQVYERAQKEGKGAVALDGVMIDEATMKRARDILKT